MDTTRLVGVLSRARIKGTAMVDGLERASKVFTEDPDEAQLIAFVTTLQAEAPHLFEEAPRQETTVARERQAVLDKNPYERLAYGHETAPSGKQRTSQRFATSEEQQTLKGKSWTQQMTEFRAMRDGA
jgi:hypothetical protein